MSATLKCQLELSNVIYIHICTYIYIYTYTCWRYRLSNVSFLLKFFKCQQLSDVSDTIHVSGRDSQISGRDSQSSARRANFWCAMLIKLTCQHIGLCRVDACCLLRYEEQFSTVRALQSVALSVAVRYKVLAKFAALFHVYSLISCIFSYFMYILLFHVYSLISCIFSYFMYILWADRPCRMDACRLVGYEWGMSDINESCPTSTRFVPYERDMFHINVSCPISMPYMRHSATRTRPNPCFMYVPHLMPHTSVAWLVLFLQKRPIILSILLTVATPYLCAGSRRRQWREVEWGIEWVLCVSELYDACVHDSFGDNGER